MSETDPTLFQLLLRVLEREEEPLRADEDEGIIRGALTLRRRAAVPALPSATVALEFWRDGQWRTENRVRTGPSGVAEIAVDPSCGDRWCDETISYRLKAGGQTARLTVTYLCLLYTSPSPRD